MDLPPPVRVVNEHGASPYVLLCEHASNFIPPQYGRLGLDAAELSRHIAWDIGALQVAEIIARSLDAPLIAAGYSRLLIDLNRPLNSATSIPAVSELTAIPGNRQLSANQKAARAAEYFEPFHARVRQVLDARRTAGRPATVVGIHSFTPVFKGEARPWHAGILYRRSTGFGHALAEALGGTPALVAENQPYQIDDESDYTVPVHGEARGLDAALVEIRQDLIGDDAGAGAWAIRLTRALGDCAPGPT